VRIYTDNDSRADIEAVNEIQDELTATPLSKYGKKGWKPRPPKGSDTTVDDPGLPTGVAFFDKLGELLKRYPPPPADQAELDKFAPIGVGPGLTPSTNPNLSADTLQGMADAVTKGPASILGDLTQAYLAGFNDHNGYLVMPTGTYGTDYELRAMVTQVGLGALTPNEALYPLAQVDRTRSPLNGSKKYVLHIPADQFPPVDPKTGFWSLTLYDSSGFFVPNPIERYLVNDRTDLAKNPDGSVDLYVQSTQPTDPVQAQNWLPSPAGAPFRMIWRLYQTRSDQIDGVLSGSGWDPPAITPIP
jgi:hypothetical protein